VTYRDDREADQARIAALEHELATAQQRVSELEGRTGGALVLAGGGALARGGTPRWFGAPLRLELTRTFDRPFPVDRFEELIATCRRVTSDHGRSELLRASLTWWATANPRGVGPYVMVDVTVKDGATTLALTDQLGQLAGAVYGGIGGGVGGGAIVLPILAAVAVPYLAPVLVVGWLGGIYGMTRAIFKRAARRRAEALVKLFDALVADISAALPA
jgi:hypothetical protein